MDIIIIDTKKNKMSSVVICTNCVILNSWLFDDITVLIDYIRLGKVRNT